MKSLFLLLACTVAINANAVTFGVETTSAEYIMDVIPQDLPSTLKDQMVAANIESKNKALGNAVTKMEAKCFDKKYPHLNQMDIITVKTEGVGSGAGKMVNKVIVEAVCRELN